MKGKEAIEEQCVFQRLSLLDTPHSLDWLVKRLCKLAQRKVDKRQEKKGPQLRRLSEEKTVEEVRKRVTW